MIIKVVPSLILILWLSVSLVIVGLRNS